MPVPPRRMQAAGKSGSWRAQSKLKVALHCTTRPKTTMVPLRPPQSPVRTKKRRRFRVIVSGGRQSGQSRAQQAPAITARPTTESFHQSIHPRERHCWRHPRARSFSFWPCLLPTKNSKFCKIFRQIKSLNTYMEY